MKKKVADFSQGAVYAYTIQNEAIHMTALNFGAVITELKTSDRSGNMENVVAAFSDIMDYERQQGPYLNAVVAPVAGRIAYGSYSMENTVHQLSINNGCHHLHGGTGGISRQLFHVEEEEQALHFHLECRHDMDGFPQGTYRYDIWYRLSGNNLIIEYHGTPPQKSLMNMTSHMYFNLSGNLRESILQHDLRIDSVEKLKIHPDGHPFEKEKIGAGSAFDFRNMTPIQKRYELGHPEFQYTRAYDTPFLLGPNGITLYHAGSGRRLDMTTDAPSLVLYSANYFDDENLELNHHRRGEAFIALALETQDLPNGVNIRNAEVHPFYDARHPYKQKTVYTFSHM